MFRYIWQYLNEMDQFSISQLEQFSGIKAHTIRIWEQRYNALNPDRSEGNTRSYNTDQLRRLLNIASLVQDGLKPSNVCRLSDSKLFELIEGKLEKESTGNTTEEYFVSQLIVASTTFNEVYFEKIFSNCVLRLGMHDTYVKVIYPLLNRIGLLWAAGKISPAYEHFCSNLIRQKLSAAIDALPPPTASRKTWLLFLPENEFHEFGLLFSYYLLKLNGKKVIYLGCNVPYETLREAVEEIRPSHLLIFLVHYDSPKEVTTYLKSLKKKFNAAVIYVAGNEMLLSALDTGKEIKKISSPAEFEKQLS